MLAIDNSIILENKANLGGGIYLLKTDFELSNSSISGNASSSGGFIYMCGSSFFSMDSIIFNDNLANQYGGVLFIKDCDNETELSFSINNTEFNNSISLSGSVIFADGRINLKSGEIENTIFQGSQGLIEPAIRLHFLKGFLKFELCQFLGNTGNLIDYSGKSG